MKNKFMLSSALAVTVAVGLTGLVSAETVTQNVTVEPVANVGSTNTLIDNQIAQANVDLDGDMDDLDVDFDVNDDGIDVDVEDDVVDVDVDDDNDGIVDVDIDDDGDDLIGDVDVDFDEDDETSLHMLDSHRFVSEGEELTFRVNPVGSYLYGSDTVSVQAARSVMVDDDGDAAVIYETYELPVRMWTENFTFGSTSKLIQANGMGDFETTQAVRFVDKDGDNRVDVDVDADFFDDDDLDVDVDLDDDDVDVDIDD